MAEHRVLAGGARRPGDPLEQRARGVLREAAPLDLAADHRLEPAAGLLQRLGARVGDHDAVAGRRRHLGDAAPHRAGAEHADGRVGAEGGHVTGR